VSNLTRADYSAVTDSLPVQEKAATHAQLAHSLRQAHDRVTRLVHVIDELRKERATLKAEITRQKRINRALWEDRQ
jgi:CRISPR/Cas system CMR subunit Cmr4 (Cas7 group RAMP superfamily)